MKNKVWKTGSVISIDKTGPGKESMGIILNKKEQKTYGFFFNRKENFKAGDKVRYKVNLKKGTAHEVTKIKNGT